MKRDHQQESSANKVPAYIVTFSDMVTLLLTFFVMLLTLAQVQDPELFREGRDAFWSSIRHMGLGVLVGRQISPDFGKVKLKYYIAESDKDFAVRSIDAKREEIERLFRKINRSMTTLPSTITAQSATLTATNIRFAPSEWTLAPQAEQFLTDFLNTLQTSGQTVQIYVLGLSRESIDEKQRWITSAKRAAAVRDYITDHMPQDTDFSVYCWGAGPGGVWAGENGTVAENTQIMIGVLRQ